MRAGTWGWVVGAALGGGVAAAALAACGTSNGDGGGGTVDQADGGNGPGSLEGGFGDAVDPALPKGETRDPETCDEAKTTKSYVGCDYWPTVTSNPVWSIFDFAVVVANTGTKDATVTVTGPGSTNQQVLVGAGKLAKIYLPWVPSLKGTDADECLLPQPVTESVVAAAGAFHLVSTTPVIVYQFNPLEYKGAGGQAPGGGAKDWSSCPGNTTCNNLDPARPIGCFSFSNDASLLLPSTAMTGNYRVAALHGFTAINGTAVFGSVTTVTATEPATQVTVSLAPNAKILASSGGSAVAIPATPGGGKVTFTLANAGDVAQLVTDLGDAYDLSGSLVQANKPIQVLASEACINVPENEQYCDHIEETVPPAETLGKRYVVHPPTGPKGTPVEYEVRLYGNKDGTALTYAPSKPAGCPDTLAAGQVADCGITSEAFEVAGTNEFAVATFLLGSSHDDPTGADLRGDPSETMVPAVEQFRTRYVFLAPDDYAVSYVDITAPDDAGIVLDGQPLGDMPVAVGGTAFGIHHVKLGAGQGGAHTLTSKLPVAIQVIGYGDNTSYEYPGGLNLALIAPPPPAPR